ncbi:MAG TPA: hypothetical protein PK622_02685 [Saprospiraceae bacterium]|jgi:uncharacterized protein YacL|nr:hypothetical protein [Saprospiraceae bacterium]
MANNTSHHILNTSTNLLGFCLFVITSLHLSNQEEAFYINELTSIVGIFLSLSCILSFISIRTNTEKIERRLEKIAEYLFLFALIGIFTVIILIALNNID